MKNIFLTTIAAVACGATTVSALDASMVRVTLKAPEVVKKLTENQITALPANVTLKTPTIDAKYTSAVPDWQVISIPVRAIGKFNKKLKPEDKSAPTPHFIDKLNIKAHVLFEVGIPKNSKGDTTRYVRATKEITYIDIPLKEETELDVKSKGGSNMVGACEFTVDLYVSPRNAAKLNKNGPAPVNADKADLKIAAIALEATHRGVNSIHTNEDKKIYDFKVYVNDPKLPPKSKAWVDSEKVPQADGELLAVCETPFAYFVHAKAPRTQVDVSGEARSSSVSSRSEYTPTITTPVTTESGAITNDDDSGSSATDSSSTSDSTVTPDEDKSSRSSRNRSKRSSRRRR